jgi:hypothetical protein
MSMLYSRCSSEYNKMIPSRQEMYARAIKEEKCYMANDFVQEQSKKGHFTVSTYTFHMSYGNSASCCIARVYSFKYAI